MAFLASFIGIDRHLDSRIRDLSGAKRDAIALWALFQDTMPEIKAELLVDEKATCQNIRQALDSTLGLATADDIVILSFSGHGSRDHRLVAHDTSKENVEQTTIPMQELADRFKQSKAKAILFILDCCFSGQAPARVWDDSPATRDSFPLENLAGKGRILIAASAKNQTALEYAGHGLLTKAFIEAMLGEDKMISVPEAIDNAAKIVRAEASRMGADQTPVWFGHIEGGLLLPCLKKGKNFFRAFPELKGIKVSADIQELKSFGIPEQILQEWKKNFVTGLNSLQLAAVNDFRILDGDSLLVVAPTSSGKTFIGEMAAIRAMMQSKKSIFLLPYRALVNEKYDSFSELYQEKLGLRVIRCTGDFTDQSELFIKGKYDLALFTYEMFLNLMVSNPNVLNQIELIVLDEAQFITDPNRGISVELLLTYIVASREQGLLPQLILLSAVIGGINDFDDWLGVEKLVTEKRPVPLTEGVIDRNGTYQYRDPSGNVQTSQILSSHSIMQRKDKPSAQDVIVPLLQKLISDNPKEKIIVFRNQRGPAEGCAKYLSKDLGLPAAIEVIEALPVHDPSTTAADLKESLNGGTAFHNSNLNRQERIAIERAFRDPNSKVRILAATTTVAAGINTPASTVILAENEFKGEDGRPFTVAEYKNMAGRAGRLGFNEQGKSIIYAENSYERNTLFQKYVMGKLEPISSTFDVQHVETWIIRLMSQVSRILEKDVIRLLSNTYGGYLAIKQNPGWREIMDERLKTLLARMESLKLLEKEGDFVQLSLLGKACGQSSLSFESSLRLVELLKSAGDEKLTPDFLMLVVQGLKELDDTYIPLMRKGQKEAAWPAGATRRFGYNVATVLQRYAGDFSDYYARCKKASLLFDWVTGAPMEEIEKNYYINPFCKVSYGDIRRIADITRYHLRSAYQIATLIAAELDQISFDSLLKRLEIGIPEAAIDLLKLPIPLERGEYMALFERNIKNLVDF